MSLRRPPSHRWRWNWMVAESDGGVMKAPRSSTRRSGEGDAADCRRPDTEREPPWPSSSGTIYLLSEPTTGHGQCILAGPRRKGDDVMLRTRRRSASRPTAACRSSLHVLDAAPIWRNLPDTWSWVRQPRKARLTPQVNARAGPGRLQKLADMSKMAPSVCAQGADEIGGCS